jgi:DASH complex subunit ASK1
MSRPSQAQRPLSLTEELEKLEQSITLTLQGTSKHKSKQTKHLPRCLAEIDHNFSQAHRIVTTSILPLVEQYTEHSRDVWEGSKVSRSPENISTRLTFTDSASVLEAILRS